MGQNWEINPATGDYLQSGGAPIESDSLAIPAYYRLKITRGSWLYAPDPGYGSTFRSIGKKPPGGDNTPIENAAISALQPILDDGRAMSITVDSATEGRNAVALGVKIQRQRGVFDNLDLPSIITSAGG